MRRAARASAGALAWAALLLATACTSPTFIDDAASRHVRRIELPDGRQQLLLAKTEGERELRAVLEEVRTGSGSDGLYRVVERQPWEEPLSWIFPLIPPTHDLELPKGQRVPHPDGRAKAELLRLVALRPPAIHEALAGLSGLSRLESRADVLVAAAAVDRLTPQELDGLIAASTTEGAGLLGPGPGGRIPGGSRAEALGGVLGRLAERADLGPARAARLAERAPAVGGDAAESRVLVTLVERGDAPTEKVLAALPRIDSDPNAARHRRDVVMALTRRRELPPAEASAVARACPLVGIDRDESAALIVLVGRGAEVAAVLEGLEGIEDPSEGPRLKKEVLLALTRRPDITPDDADAIAGATSSVGSDPLEAEVLLQLVARERVTSGAIIRALRSFDEPAGPRQRLRVLLRLIALRGRVASETGPIASAIPAIDDDAAEAEALLALIAKGEVLVAAIIDAVSGIDGSAEAPTLRRDVLLALEDARGGAKEPADLIAAAAPIVGDDLKESELLTALIERNAAATSVLLEAMEELDQSADAPRLKRDLLMQLVGRRGTQRADADALAAFVPEVGEDAREAEVLLALLEARAVSTEAVLRAARSLGSGGAGAAHAHAVLRSLAVARGAERAHGDLIARFCPRLDDDRSESDVLKILAQSEAPSVEAILDGAEGIDTGESSPSHLTGVLEALCRRKRLERADADRVARACPAVDSDRFEADLLLLLVRKASREAVADALDEIESPAERERVQKALGAEGS